MLSLLKSLHGEAGANQDAADPSKFAPERLYDGHVDLFDLVESGCMRVVELGDLLAVCAIFHNESTLDREASLESRLMKATNSVEERDQEDSPPGG